MEKQAFRLPGFVVLLVVLAALVGLGFGVVASVSAANRVGEATAAPAVLAGLIALVAAVGFSGFVVVNPNEAIVVQFFGSYVGSVRVAGFSWVFPFTSRRRVSLRVRNFESARLKVNDLDGNPVEIAAVVVWRIVDSAEATFAVDAYQQFIQIQTEAAVRHLATSYAYDSHVDGVVSLRDGAQVAEELTVEIRERVALAGVEVIESRITHLAYAPEIAQVMLQRQQAGAIVAARSRIVEGAVGMVQLALDRLRAEEVVELDEERKAAMVSNLLVVLCGDRATQPVVNAGTLYG
jgi:regulator of protease activity HflC (stomatin/prohibitin superfamily)